MADRTALYRFYGEGDVLLYVGISAEPNRRRQQHHDQDWWPKVETQVIEWHDTRERALHEELRAIRREHPKYNRAGVLPGGVPAFAETNARPNDPRGSAPIDVEPALREMLKEIKGTEDAGERGALATEFLQEVKEFNRIVSTMRREAALTLQGSGWTYEQIGEYFGPEGKPLHFTRIRQIIKGGATGKWAKVARDEAAAREAAAED